MFEDDIRRVGYSKSSLIQQGVREDAADLILKASNHEAARNIHKMLMSQGRLLTPEAIQIMQIRGGD